MFHEDSIIAIFSMAIPIVAIVGGITLAIIRVLGQSRLAELARRERIAAIERGIDPDKLPPLANGAEEWYGAVGDSRLRRAHGLMIGGFVLVAVGVSTMIFLRAVESDKPAWLLGLLPFLVGAALLGSCAIIWPRKS